MASHGRLTLQPHHYPHPRYPSSSSSWSPLGGLWVLVQTAVSQTMLCMAKGVSRAHQTSRCGAVEKAMLAAVLTASAAEAAITISRQLGQWAGASGLRQTAQNMRRAKERRAAVEGLNLLGPLHAIISPGVLTDGAAVCYTSEPFMSLLGDTVNQCL